MPTEDPILEKIRAVLRLAEDPATPEEARENHMAHAHKMIAKYGVDQALLAAASADPAEITSVYLTVKAPYARDRAQLVHELTEALRLPSLRLEASGKAQTFHVFGTRPNLDRFELLLRSLEIQMVVAMSEAERSGRGPWPGQAKITWRKSFMSGYTTRVAERVAAADRTAAEGAHTADGSSAALVLKSDTDRAQAAFRIKYPHTRSTSRGTCTSGFGAGEAAADRADIGGTRIGNDRLAIGS